MLERTVAAVEHDALHGDRFRQVLPQRLQTLKQADNDKECVFAACTQRTLTVSVLPVPAGPSGAPFRFRLYAPMSVR